MKTATVRNFHVPLPEPMYQRLKRAADIQHRPATQVVKQAIEYWLDEQERLALHEEIGRYAATAAGGNDDLDESLEKAALECLEDTECGR